MNPPSAEFPSHRQPAIRTIAMPSDTNPAGDIFGGWLMGQMDLAAGNVAVKRAHCRVATLAVDRMMFLSPVHVGDEISLFAEVVRVGRTSMEIEVDAWRRKRISGQALHVTHARFTCVALDGDGRPTPIPPE